MRGCLRHAGDVETDFFLAFDLLRNPKDHFEFTQVRNWIKRALMVRLLLPSIGSIQATASVLMFHMAMHAVPVPVFPILLHILGRASVMIQHGLGSE